MTLHVKPPPMAIARASWWRRLLSKLRRRPVIVRCSRCGLVCDNGQRLPRGTREVCAGVVDFSVDPRNPRSRVVTFCMRFLVRHG